MASIQKALLEKQTSVIINQEEMIINQSTMLFLISCGNNFQCIPHIVNDHFRIVMFTPPDTKMLLEVGLMQSGMSACGSIIPSVSGFLSKVEGIFHVFSFGFHQQRLDTIISCFQRCYKEMVLLESKKLTLVCDDGEVTNSENEFSNTVPEIVGEKSAVGKWLFIFVCLFVSVFCKFFLIKIVFP